MSYFCPVPEITDTKGQRFDFLLFFVLLRSATNPHNLHPPSAQHLLTHRNFSLGQAPTNGSAFLSIATAVNGDTINI
eukprot:scaffold27123_cov73-Skeletonema_marinoi.AAC.2